VARVLAAPAIEELVDRNIGKPEGIVELSVREQTTVGGDPGAMELELDPPVETDPKRLRSRFTHRVRHDRTPPRTPTF
jgi:hypothetical protein